MINRVNAQIKKKLQELSEPEFQKFSSSLIPNIQTEKVIGVRLPALRKIARTLASEDWAAYLKSASDDSFEEIMLQGMVLGYVEAEPKELFPAIDVFLHKIDNWSVCDSFCSGLKAARKWPQEMWNYIEPLFYSNQEYFVRFAVVMLIFYFIEEERIDDLLKLLGQISVDSYYVKMAVAWAVSICFISFSDQVMPFLKENGLDDFTYNKAIQEICESRQVSFDIKQTIKAMKRKI